MKYGTLYDSSKHHRYVFWCMGGDTQCQMYAWPPGPFPPVLQVTLLQATLTGDRYTIIGDTGDERQVHPHRWHCYRYTFTGDTVMWWVRGLVCYHKDSRIFLMGGLTCTPSNFHSRAQKSAHSIRSFMWSGMSAVSSVLYHNMNRNRMLFNFE